LYVSLFEPPALLYLKYAAVAPVAVLVIEAALLHTGAVVVPVTLYTGIVAAIPVIV
jgi:hypothetical protein